MTLALWMGIGCGGAEAVPEPMVPIDDVSFTDPEAPWLGPADDTSVEVDSAEVTATIEAAFGAVRTLDPAPLFDAYTNAMSGADGGCPAFFTAPEGFDYWFDTCEAASGARFDGFGVVDVVADTPVEGGLLGSTFTVGGSGEMVGPDGSVVDLNGFAQLTAAADDTITFQSLLLSGSFATDDPVAVGTWLEEPYRPELTLIGYDFAGVGEILAINGVLDGLPDPVAGGLTTVVLQNVVVAQAATGLTDCPEEPTGVISVRLPTGWVDVLFDPVDTGNGVVTPDGTCDGCGVAWSGTQSLGDVCPDVTRLFAE